MGLPFTRDAHDAVADGSLTVTWRAWTRPMVKIGGRYVVGAVTVEVTSLDRVPAATVPSSERARLGDVDPVWRVAFQRVEPVAKRQLSHDELAARLDRLDRASTHGPWTRAALALIRDNPGVVSTKLAAIVDRERFAFKADVRKLKALGLTESLDVGYRLSSLGEAYVKSAAI
jgi:hypothetical protein